MSCDTQRLLSVVVIGLNEQDRLQACLDAIFACKPQGFDLEVLYVDSGSTDRSVEIASAVPGVEVLHLGAARRSAARARNVGLKRAKGRYVQLVDGDSVIEPGWIDTALDVLEQRPEISCVFGRCTEMHPDQSVYTKVCGFDWHIPTGERRFCGGNSMWRMSVIAEHGFFDENLRIGEEPDLCYRVRHRGGRILCIDVPMVLHDLGMHRFVQYWNRAVTSGKGYALIATRFWKNSEKMWLREMLVNFVEPTASIVMLVVGWQVLGWAGAAALVSGWWLIRALQIAYTVRARQLGFGIALMYGLHCQFVRFPLAIGQLTALFGLRHP